MASEIKKRSNTSKKRRDTPSKAGEEECPTCKDLKAKIEELEAELKERKIIEKAKWILVKQKGLSEEEALNLLRETARFSQKKIYEIASNLVTGEKILSGSFPEDRNQQ